MPSPFAFNSTDPSTPEGRNWRVLDESTKFKVRSDLVFTGGTGTPTVDMGYFTMYGPLIFYIIKVTLNNNEGWAAVTSYIQVPFSEFIVGTTTQQCTHTGEAYVGGSGAAITRTILLTADTTKLSFLGTYTNTTGADQVVFLQGWYIRD